MARVHLNVLRDTPRNDQPTCRPKFSAIHSSVGIASLVLLGALCSVPALAGAQPLDAGPLIGDGSTRASVHVLLEPGTRVRASASQGDVIEVLPVAGGAVVVWVPPVVQEPTDVPLVLKIRGGGVKQDLTYQARVVPGWIGGFQFVFDPPQLAPGGSATVTVRATSPGASTLKRTVKAKVSHGKLTALVASDDGTWTARYTAPANTDGPIRPLFIATDMAAPTDVYGTATLGVTSQHSITLDAPADSTNVLVLGGREYGPVIASPAGTIAFDLNLHPDRMIGELRSTSRAGDEEVTNPAIPVPVPTSLAWMPLPPKAGSATSVELLIACRTGANSACSPADVSVETSGGEVGLLRPDGDSILRSTWIAPSSGTATLTATSGDQSSVGSVPILPGPLDLTLTSDPFPLHPKRRDFKLVARAKDLQGKAVTRRTPIFRVQEAQLIRRPVGTPDSSYVGTWRLNYRVDDTQVAAWTRVRPTGLPVHRLVAWPAQDVVDVEVGGKMPVFIIAEDATGMPVSGVTLSLAVPVGDGSMVGTFKTDYNGVAAVPYSIGTRPGPVLIDIEGAGMTTSATLWQASPEAPVATVVKTGSASKHQAIERWRKRIPSMALARGEAAPVVVASTGPAVGIDPANGVVTSAETGSTTNPAIAGPKGEYATARLRGMLRGNPLKYSAQLKGDAQLFAPEATFTNLMYFGLHLDGEVWIGSARAFGLDLRAHAGAYRVQIGFDSATAVPLEIEGGARYRVWDTGTWSAYTGAGVSRTQSVVFAYTNDARTSVDMLNYSEVGFRAGGGLRGEFGPSMVDFNVQTVWSPSPNMVRAELIGEVPLKDNLLLTGGVGADARSFGYRFADSTDNKIRVTQMSVDIRAGVAIPFF